MTRCTPELIEGTAADYACRRCGAVFRNVKLLPIHSHCRLPGEAAEPSPRVPRVFSWMGKVSPGRAMHELLADVGLREASGCGCRALASKMDRWGIEGCQANRQEIVEHLDKAAAGVPWCDRLRASSKLWKLAAKDFYSFVVHPASFLLDEALRRAQRRPLELLFHLPPGIGDCSWVYSKIAGVAETRGVGLRVSQSGLPRALDFVRLLPHVETLGWGQPWNDSTECVGFDEDLAGLEPGEYHLFANPHLEGGGRIEGAWPKQETRYHYAIDTTPAMAARAEQILDAARGEKSGETPLLRIGLYACAGREDAWGEQFWRLPQWLELAAGVAKLFPHTGVTFVCLGALYDVRTQRLAAELRRGGHQVIECFGAHIGVTIELIKRLDYFFAYPSGLGILGDVLDVPTLMFYWPGFHDLFLNSYADPQNVAKGRHLNLLFGAPAAALEVFKARGRPWIEGS